MYFFQHERSLENSDLKESTRDSASKKITKIYLALLFCWDELGIWLALKVFILSVFRFSICQWQWHSRHH